MTRFFISLLAVFAVLGLFVQEADARRFGGGRSFGIQRTAPAPKATPTAPTRNAPTGTQPRRSGVFGAVAGLAAGLGLAALFTHLGLGPEMATFFLVALLGFGALMIFRRLARMTPNAQPSMAYAGQTQTGGSSSASPAHAATDSFDEAAFCREAKLNFIRLQAAYDVGNLDDIHTFTSPEVFAEIKMQYDERAGADQKTDVIDLQADIIEATEEAARYVVSVRFSGLIREHADTPPAPFDEIWHLTKPRGELGGWRVSGIQQTH